MKRHIEVGQRRLYTEQIGRGRPAVVIETGMTQAGTQDLGWRPICDALAADRDPREVGPDLRVEAVAVHAEVAGGVAKTQEPG